MYTIDYTPYKLRDWVRKTLLEQNQDKINWWELSLNPKAIYLLEQRFFWMKEYLKGQKTRANS